jgi:hypothetical protein
MDTPKHPERDSKVDENEIVTPSGNDADVEVEIVDVEEYGRKNTPPPKARHYKVKIDHIHHVFDHRFVTGREILVAGGKTPIEKYELEKRLHGGQYVAIEPDEEVDLGEPGIEVFETFPLDETEG